MANQLQVVAEFDTGYGHYQITDQIYDSRTARVLYSGDKQAAQSGIALDDKPDLLFDYNQRLVEALCAVLSAKTPARILIIGGGMLTLPTALLALFPKAQIDVVEIDSELFRFACQYFGATQSPNLKVIADDGLHYLSSIGTSGVRYDAIVFDAYTHASSEPSLATPAAAIAAYQCLEPGGVLLANVISAYYGRRAQALITMQANFAVNFNNLALHPASAGLSLWLPQNFIFAASNTPLERITNNLRFPAITNGYSRQYANTVQALFDLRRDLT